MLSQKLLTASTGAMLAWALRRESQLQAYLQRLALAAALEAAYVRFARCHPRWADSLFDRYFLTTIAGPLLARYWQAGQPPTPADLATAWLDQLRLRAPGRFRPILLAQVTPVAADFLAYLEEELNRYRGGPVAQRELPAPEPCPA